VREYPDVIMVGEVRDPETALEALRASLPRRGL
jgi:type II secretory ATPase GspE/PulE/Tfp pilus assembly ATPase PilB-like protein